MVFPAPLFPTTAQFWLDVISQDREWRTWVPLIQTSALCIFINELFIKAIEILRFFEVVLHVALDDDLHQEVLQRVRRRKIE